MKKLSFVLFFTIITSLTSYAQDKGKLSYGGRIGVAISDFTGSAGESRSGIQVGAFVGYDISRFGLEFGTFYSEQGANNMLSGFNRYDTQIDYINFELLVKYRVFNKFRVFIGPQVSLMTNASSFLIESDERFDESSDFNNLDLGITGGIGYKFDFGLDLSASYTQGLKNIYKKERTAYNTVFCVSVGWRF